LKVPFQLEGGVRKDETPVHEAVREALVNALIHADYSAPGGIVIQRYPDHFVLANPGRLLVAMEQLRRGGVSECRNKALQKMFQMMGGGERAGSGFDKIQTGWRSQHWRAPHLHTQVEPDRVILDMPMVSLIPEKAHQALQARFGNEYRRLSEAEVQALATAYLEDEVSNTRLQELMTDHPVEITKMLNGLCDRGFLFSDQKRRWTRYHLTEKAPSSMPLFDQIGLQNKTKGLPTERGGDSQHKAGGLPTQEAEDSQHKEKVPTQDEVSQIVGSELAALEKIAEPIANSRRASPTTTRQVILSLCENRFLTAADFGKLLHRHQNAIQQRFLNSMVKDGFLELRYPEATNRPDQAYRKRLKEGSK
jgi:ATP-dependent DNA helicase RecG